MPVIEDTKTQYTCVDTSGLRHEPKFTETAGVIVGAQDNGYFTTSRPEVAAELQEKYPHMLVTKHEAYAGNKARRTINWTVPDLPGTGWTRHNPDNGTREAQAEAEHRAG